jgi:hypothetical protein
MTSFFLSLYRALTTPDGSFGEMLSARRKSHPLQASWYSRLAAAGEAERKAGASRHVELPVRHAKAA